MIKVFLDDQKADAWNYLDHLLKLGYDARLEYDFELMRSRWHIVCHTEEEAALVKLTHL